MRVVRRRCVASSFSAESAERIIVALDGMAPDQALAFSAQVEGLRWVKVGLELFVQAGPEVVAQLRDQGLRVFLDLKFHDIPATMAGACRRAAALGAELITVHACAGSEALQAAQAAAVEGAQSTGQRAPNSVGGHGAHQLGGAAAATGTRHQPGHRRTGAGLGPAVGDCRYRRLCVFAVGGRGVTGSASRAVCLGNAGDSPQRRCGGRSSAGDGPC